MKLKKLSVIILILAILFFTSAVSAAELNDTDLNSINDDYSNLQLNESHNSLSSDLSAVYVDADNGNDLNDGKSQETSVQSFERALNLSDDDCSIYLSDGNYTGMKNTKISINKSITVIGSSDTTFDGLNTNFIFNISDGVSVTFKNIKFVNAYKQTRFDNPVSVYGGALEINNATVTIDGCSFLNNTVNYNPSVNKINYGGAISNFGDLTILNSYFESNFVASTSGLFSYGGAIYNKGKLLINSTAFNKASCDDFGYGGAIYNDGDLIMDNSIIANSYSRQETKASAVFNAGNFTLTNSIIENNTICRANFYYIYGAIYNYGNLNGYGNIFRNNTGVYEAPNPEYRGSPTIFNMGNINLTYCVFMDNAPFNGIASDVYNNGGDTFRLDNNWWATNENPYTKSKINVDSKLNSWLILNLIPEYSAINIGDNADITAFWSLSSTLTPDISLLPVLNVTFKTSQGSVIKQLVNGQVVFNFNSSQVKGSYDVMAIIGGFSEKAVVDVGKTVSNISVNVTGNVLYTEDVIFNIEVSGADGNTPGGNVTVIFDDEAYTVNLSDGKGLLNLSFLDPGEYEFKIVYEGSEDYFKSFDYKNVTVNKAPTELSVVFPDIYVDQKGTVTVTLGPKGVQGQAYLYINGVRKKVLYLYNGNTSVSLSNFAEGTYNVTVEFWGTKYYEASSASTKFSVSKYDVDFNLTVKDISVGENQIVSISVYPSDLQGEAILNINGVNQTIFLESQTTNITVSNLGYGSYDIWVFFPENQKYHSCNKSASFKVLRNLTSLDVEIVEDGLNGTMTVKTNYTNCRGSIGVYVNYRLYYANLTDGVAKFDVVFDKGTNYIYVFYDGDRNYEASSWNTTLGVAEEFILIGLNATGYKFNDFNYTVHLIESTGIPMPNRVVSVIFEGKNHTIITDEEGIACLPLNLNNGSYIISATYKNQTVFNSLVIKDIEFNVTVCNISFGENEAIEAEFESNVTGKANFVIENILNSTVSISNGKAVCNVSSLNVGNYEVIVKYVNDYFNSSEIIKEFEVKKADPVINAAVNDIVYGSDGIIEVSISNATGDVVFTVDGVTTLKQLADGACKIILSNMDKGIHNVTITYKGDSNYNKASLNSTFSVKDAYSEIMLYVNDSRYGENITVVAILNETATGYVTFNVSNISKDVEIVDGKANWTFSGINAGSYVINASYMGDHTFISSANSTSFDVLKANSTVEIQVGEVYLNENILIYAILSQNATGSVSFSITDYYSPRLKPISNSVAVWYISPLTTGHYTVIAGYGGDNNYYSSNTTYDLVVRQRKSVLTAEIADASINDRVTAKIKLTASDGEAINGSVTLTIGPSSYNVLIRGGSGTLVLGKIAPANYTYYVVYEGNENFSKSSVSGSFRVAEGLLNLKLTAKNVTYYYGSGHSYVVKASDESNNPVSGVDITIKVDGKTYTLTTDSDGQVSIPIDFSVGSHNVESIFYESSRYYYASLNTTINILTTLEGIDVTSLYGTTAQYFAIFTDSDGKALANTAVTFTIGDKSYSVTTLTNGITKINLDFAPGRYVISTVNPATGQKISNNIFIFLKLMENKDITTYYKAGQTYSVRAYDNNGNPVSGGVVKITVNGKTYSVKTDSKGYATLKLNLKANTYSIKATYNGFTVSNTIKVKSLLIFKKLSVKKGKKIVFKVKLVNKYGKIVKGKKIKFKFKGKKYKVKTNKKGIATLKLKTKLKKGTYKIKAKYGKCYVIKKIKVKK